MLGWGIDIKKQSSGNHVANWDTGLRGIDWLEKLVEEKRAVCEQTGFYPSVYTAQAKEILPILQEMPPFVMRGLKWKRGMFGTWKDPEEFPYCSIFQDEISTCDPDEILRITVWNLS